jgi:flagellar basal-body rod protein FlgF
MDKLAFTSLAAVQSATQIRAQITNSMANVSTVGFKDSYEVAAQAIKLDGAGYQSRFQPAVKARDIISLQPGVLTQTGNPMDVSFNDKTVLGVQAADGAIAFTRRGDLRVTSTGVIENAAGHLVLGEAGPITVPAGMLVTLSSDGTVFASSPTDSEVPPVAVGNLMLRDASVTPLIRREDGLFQPLDLEFRGIDFPTGPGVASLQSGTLEGSNVNPIETMIKLMDFSRSFEAQIKMITQTKSIDETGSSMMRLP